MTRELYNACLQERRDAWRKQAARVTAFDQMHALAAVREVRPEFSAIPVVVQRGAVRRLDRAFAGFFRRCKSGEKPGYPRFRGAHRWDSILIDDLGGKVPVCAGGRRVKIPLLGKVKFKQHRPIEGAPKALRIKRDGDGHWYVIFSCVDVPDKPLPLTNREVGVDLGLTTFAATSDGEMFENPRALETARLGIERAQRRVSRRKRGSHRRRKAANLLARQHFHIGQIRRQNAINVANSLVRKYDTIYVEALNIVGLARGMLAKQVSDAGWGNFLHWLRVKAECAGREIVEVNPAGTSQVCSECGCEVPKGLAVRIHDCPHCGYVADRDVNAAQNVLRLGKSLRGEALEVIRPRRSAKSKSPGQLDRITSIELTSGESN
jgi:putative transposase